MPTIYTVKAPDGTLLDIEGPDNATDEQVAAFAAQQYAASQPAGDSGVTLRPDIKDPAERESMGLPPLPAPQTTPEGLAGAITRGLAPVAAGAALGGLVGGPAGAGIGALAAPVAQLVGDPIVDMINARLGTSYSTPTEAVENLLTTLGVPQAQTPTERIAQTAAGAVGGAGGMIAGGRALAAGARAVPSLMQGVGRTMAAQPSAQIAGAAAGGAAQQGVAEAGGGPVAQLGAGLAGSIAGGRVATNAPRQPLPAIVAEAERANVPLMTSDVIAPNTFAARTLQATGERIPLAGTGPVRAAQQDARVRAVRDLVQDYTGTPAEVLPEQIVADLARQRGQTLTRYTAAKEDVIERLAGSGTVPLSQTITALDDQIAALARRRTGEGDEAIERLQQIKTDIQNRNLFELEAYRRDVLANVFKDDPARPMSVGAREAGEKALRAIYDPVRRDMGDFIKSVGDRRDFDKWAVANKRLSQEAGELQNNALKRILRTGDVTPENVQSLLFSSKPSDVAALYRNLSPQGRATARQAIILRAAQKATARGEVDPSPTRFANQVADLGKSIGVFFNGEELARVQGLARVLQATKRAGEAAVFTPTGQQNVLPTAAIGGVGAFGGGFEGFVGAMIAAATIGGLSRLYESAPVRDMLLQAAKTTKQDQLVEIGKKLVVQMQADTNEDTE